MDKYLALRIIFQARTFKHENVSQLVLEYRSLPVCQTHFLMHFSYFSLLFLNVLSGHLFCITPFLYSVLHPGLPLVSPSFLMVGILKISCMSCGLITTVGRRANEIRGRWLKLWRVWSTKTVLKRKQPMRPPQNACYITKGPHSCPGMRRWRVGVVRKPCMTGWPPSKERQAH